MLAVIRPTVGKLLRGHSFCVHRLCVHNDSVLENIPQLENEFGKPLRQRKPQVISPEMLALKLKDNYAPLKTSGPDTFGDLSSATDIPAEFFEGDEADKDEVTEYSKQVQEREHIKVDYAALITELLSEKKFNMALEVLETQMKNDKVKPDRYIFVQLITFCGKVGYPQRAFKLFNDMKKRAMAVTSAVYTSLFNGCANCPDSEVGLKHALKLREIMRTKGFHPNAITYNAMIKAFGRCGDLETAFSLADEMMSKKMLLNVETISFLLQTCISNKEKGFQYALLVWRKMRQYRIKPNIHSYNLMLRCVRDTGLGDFESLAESLEKLLPRGKTLLTAKKTESDVHLSGGKEVYPWDMATKDIVSGNTSSEPNPDPSLLPTVTAARPDLLAPIPTLGGLVVVEEIKSASDRLILLGGVKGFVRSMLQEGANPDVRTFTLLLACIPSTVTAEENLLREMALCGETPDTAFFNALIHRRSLRGDHKEGFAVLDLLKDHGLEMDVITLQSLAYCCTNKDTFIKFITDMKETGYNPTPPMLGAVMKSALSSVQFGFIHFVMDAYLHEEVPVHKGTLQQLEEFYKRNVRLLRGKDEPPERYVKLYTSDYFRTGMKLFCCKYADWKKRITVEETSEAQHWDQFKKSGKEIEEIQPYIQRWRKGSRYAKAVWRKNQSTYIPPDSEK